MKKQLILASASPRRAELLRQIGMKFEIHASHADEQIHERLLPSVVVAQLAMRKAMAVANELQEGIVLGADTVVVYQGEILGKPQNEEDAYHMLKKLSGNRHEVMTGVSLIDAQNTANQWHAVETTSVWFRPLTEEDIYHYLRTGEYRDKAGSYGIQGKGALLVEKIEGCYFNVVGLPLHTTAIGLKTMGIDVYHDGTE